MDAWSTVAGMRAMESINSIAQDVDKLGRNYPTLRDQFAMSALIGLVSTQCGLLVESDAFAQVKNEAIAKECYKLADAMLAERSKEN